jgi:peptidoglycan hydrolase-like protein with peptidoglycan-binding domain
MNQTETFLPEAFPRELAMEQSPGTYESEIGSLELEEELRRASGFRPSTGRSRSGRPPMPRAGMPRRPGTTRPGGPPRRPRRWPAGAVPWAVYPEPFPVAGEPDTGVSAPQGSEYVRWTQECLNRVMSAQLPVDGVMTPATRSLVRSFQQRENLAVTGIVGPDTEEALKRACAGAAASATGDAQPDQEWGLEAEEEELSDIFGRIKSGIGAAVSRVGKAIGDCKIIDLTAQSDRSVRKGTRDPKTVYALVLHQMACCFRRRDPLKSYLRIKSHFAILPEGQILQLHPVSALIWASPSNSPATFRTFVANGGRARPTDATASRRRS